MSMETSYSQWCKLKFARIIEEMEPDVRRVVEMAFQNVAEAFWHVPASSTGKYHPIYACGDAGLARHTLAAVHFCKQHFIMDDTLTKHEQDIVIAAMLLHDTCKLGLNFENKYTVFEHPVLVRQLLFASALTVEGKIWAEITHLCDSHMGRWNTANVRDIQNRRMEIAQALSKVRPLPVTIETMSEHEALYTLTLPKPKDKLQKIVARSDFLAADKECMLHMFDGMSDAWAGVRRE